MISSDVSLDTLIIFDPVVVICKEVYVFLFCKRQGLNAFTSSKNKQETTKNIINIIQKMRSNHSDFVRENKVIVSDESSGLYQ